MLVHPRFPDVLPFRIVGANDQDGGNDLIVILIALLANMRRPRSRPSKVRGLRIRKILAVLDEHEPRTGKIIAKLAGMRLDGQLRSILADLKRQGKITRPRGSWGYVLVPDPKPLEDENGD
jgi:hypothetical protein